MAKFKENNKFYETAYNTGGSLVCAVGYNSHAEGRFSCAVGVGSYGMGGYENNPLVQKCINDHQNNTYSETGNTYQDIPASEADFFVPVREEEEDMSYIDNIVVYRRHLYREELKKLGLEDIGRNSLGLHPTTNRDDIELCKKILNNFGNNMAEQTNFEKRMYHALTRKEEIDVHNRKLLEKLKRNKLITKNKFDKALETLTGSDGSNGSNGTNGYDDFINQLDDDGFVNGLNENRIPEMGQQEQQERQQQQQERQQQSYLDSQRFGNIPQVPQSKPKEKTDDELVKYYNSTLYSKDNFFTVEDVTEDEIRYIDYNFTNGIDENSEDIDCFVELGGEAMDYVEKSANELIRELDDDNSVPNIVGSFLGKFTKKNVYVTRIRVPYNVVLEKAKEKYS